ncbi:hypothetical protein EHP00_345 [Ecytonucleospora hepatopenaei]|uniref:Uncharacterized protein n=1 Tax=Ecytonucleospora hepatopenaei TaxID=646526 RepID=A0A1W0E2H1_9MICR|nr:hypothetical protein EHP00_345 [Ecytonucleospora hepatopenaei]
MARFFNAENNDKDEKKSTKFFEIEEEKNTLLSKKDKKITEFEQKIKELLKEKNPKVFEKSFRKFMSDLKKFVVNQKNTVELSGLSELFKVVTNKQNIKLINEYNQLFASNTDQEENVENFKNEVEAKEKENTIEDILEISDENEKIRELEKNSENLESFMPLYFLYSKNKKYNKMLDMLERMKGLNCEKASFIKNNMKKCIEHLIFEKQVNFKRLLNICEQYNLKKEVEYIKIFKFDKIDCIESELLVPVVAVKTKNYQMAIDKINLSLFNKNKKSIEYKAFEFMAIRLLKANFIKAAYEIFVLFDNDRFLFEKQACSILLEDFSRDFFKKEFLEEFKCYDTNLFLLKSEQKQMELCRAFFYLNSGCKDICVDIINNIFRITAQ